MDGLQGGYKPGEPRLHQPGKDVQWVPTPSTLVEKMLDLAELTPQDRLVISALAMAYSSSPLRGVAREHAASNTTGAWSPMRSATPRRLESGG